MLTQKVGMHDSEERVIVLGGAVGAWGDSSFSLAQLLDSGRCDYILFEALAEVTMGILTRARQSNPELGYASDIIQMIGRELSRFSEQGVKAITNAGGVNPEAAARLLRSLAERSDVSIRVAWIEGDNLLGRMDELRALDLTEMSDGAPLIEDPLSFNAYLGARPIAAALDAGADVVITGRCVDSALALGPLIHEFGWGVADLDRLSQGSLVGHLLECGPQSTGGLLTDWQDVRDLENVGYPLAECRADGSFVLTKPDGTGGLVDVRTVAEQLLYEIGDPGAYRLPDVTCDWRFVELMPDGPDRIRVQGARGLSAPLTFKACAQELDGFKSTTILFIGGREARRKAERLYEVFLERARRVLERDGFPPLRDRDLEVLGAESTYGPHSRASDVREVVAKVALHHDSLAALSAIVREAASLGLSIVGLSAGGTGLAKPTPVLRLRSYLVPRDRLAPSITIDGQPLHYQEPVPADSRIEPMELHPFEAPHGVDEPVTLPLIAIAHARSGDKGPHANIGIRARDPQFLPLIRDRLRASVVAEWFAHRRAPGAAVERYDLPGIDAVNFVLHDALGGGGIGSLRFDPQGKAYAQQLLDFPLEVPAAWIDHPSIALIPEVEAARRQRASDRGNA